MTGKVAEKALVEAARTTVLCPCCAHLTVDTAEECGGYRDGKRIPGRQCNYAKLRAALEAYKEE